MFGYKDDDMDMWILEMNGYHGINELTTVALVCVHYEYMGIWNMCNDQCPYIISV